MNRLLNIILILMILVVIVQGNKALHKLEVNQYNSNQ
jgi:hypothetical protein